MALRGTVFDSLARAPLPGATVQAVRADARTNAFTASTDSLGRFRLDSLAPGRYLLGFLHPALDVLGVEIKPVVVDLTAGVAGDVALAIPGPAAMRSAVCPALAPDDSAGAVAGAVRDADSGAPAVDATVVLSWSETLVSRQGLRTEQRRVPVTVRPDGSYLVCGVPSDGAVDASATAPGRTSGLVEVAAPPRGLVVRHFALGPAAAVPGSTTAASAIAADTATAERGGLPTPATGTARLAGLVVTTEGQPVPGARVRVWGTAGRTEAIEGGRFALADLPSGTFTLEARAIGREPTRVAVDLASGRTAQLRVAMPKAVPELQRVVVRGTVSRASRDLDGFLARRRTGIGTYYNQADIDQRAALDLTDVLRTAPGLRVIPVGARGNAIRGRDNCIPAVYLDGVRIADGADEIDALVRPSNVAAIEVYRGGATVPVQFNSTSSGGSLTGGAGCGGAVLIWTRR